jgi:glycerol-3-phosphate dehydrogenase
MSTTEQARGLQQALSNRRFDLIVIGAGINGTGIARDAAMRGLKVLLVEKHDIGSGTTPWSTRLIHGGLRYLEHYEVSLVRESLRERERLLHIAPHLVNPLTFMIPIYKGHKRGPGMIRLGMIGYDLLSWDKSLDRHHMLNREQTLTREPGLDPEGLRGSAIYYDAQITFPERLSVENALSALEHEAVIITYARVDNLIIENGHVAGIEATDLLDDTDFSARGAVTVNVAGPWVDMVLDGHETKRLIGGTKGTHIVVDRFEGAPDEALYVEAVTDQRPYFIVPWNGRYLIGTTDIRYDEDLNTVVPDEEEITYLISETNRVLPSANLERADVQFAYAGVRPLPYQDEGSTGSITRRHIIHDHAPLFEGLISIVGGKITTFRNLSEEATDAVFKKLGRTTPPSTTQDMKLPGALAPNFERYASVFKATSGLDDDAATRMLHIYGTRSRQVLKLADDAPDLRETFSPATGAIGAEVVFAVQEEMATTLEDVLLRRTMVGLDDSVGLDAIDAAAYIARRHLGWSAERADAEVSRYRTYVERFKPRALSSEPASTV